jgi:hypothetical protein
MSSLKSGMWPPQGPRGSGGCVARQAGWATHDVYEIGSQADFRVTFAKLATVLLRSMSLKQRMKKRAVAALSVVKAFAEFAPPGFRFRLEVDAAVGKADSGRHRDRRQRHRTKVL